jgi:hypothetical protein
MTKKIRQPKTKKVQAATLLSGLQAAAVACEYGAVDAGAAPDAPSTTPPQTIGSPTGPWTNLRSVALCPLCKKEHVYIVAFLRRHSRRPYTSGGDLAWLREHAAAVGLSIEQS